MDKAGVEAEISWGGGGRRRIRSRKEMTKTYILYLESFTCCTGVGVVEVGEGLGRRMNKRNWERRRRRLRGWTIRNCFCKFEQINCKLESLLFRVNIELATGEERWGRRRRCCPVVKEGDNDEHNVGANSSNDSINRFLTEFRSQSKPVFVLFRI